MRDVCVCAGKCMYLYLCRSVYLYLFIYRERGGERERILHVSVHL